MSGAVAFDGLVPGSLLPEQGNQVKFMGQAQSPRNLSSSSPSTVAPTPSQNSAAVSHNMSDRSSRPVRREESLESDDLEVDVGRMTVLSDAPEVASPESATRTSDAATRASEVLSEMGSFAPRSTSSRLLRKLIGVDVVRRPSVDATVANVLSGAAAVKSKAGAAPASPVGSPRNSTDYQADADDGGAEQAKPAAANLVADQVEANLSIFTEDGQLPAGTMVIRFLSPLAVTLDKLRILFSVWTLLYTPVLLCFDEKHAGLVGYWVSHVLELCGDLLFFFCVPIAFVTTLGDTQLGREYLSLKKIARLRLRSWKFWCDSISVLPFLIGIFTGQLWTAAWWHLLKLFRFHWFMFMPASLFETRFLSKFQVLRMLLWIAMIMHLMACLWYWIVVNTDALPMHLQHLTSDSSSAHYLYALRTGGYMVTGKPVTAFSAGELILIVVSSPLGGIFFAFIYGNTTMLLTRMNIQMSKHHKHIAIMQRTLATLDIPPELRSRITKYHHFLAVHHNTNAYAILMQGLSMNLFIELRAHLFKKLFSEGLLFENAPAGFLRSLLQLMVEVTFCPGDLVIRCGDLGDEMYFVVKGRLEVLDAESNVIGKIGETQYFGEVALLVSTPRLVTIRAATYCLLAMIMRDKFVPVIDAHPEMKEKMMQRIKNYKYPPEEEKDEDGNVHFVGSQQQQQRKSRVSFREVSKEGIERRRSSRCGTGNRMSLARHSLGALAAGHQIHNGSSGGTVLATGARTGSAAVATEALLNMVEDVLKECIEDLEDTVCDRIETAERRVLDRVEEVGSRLLALERRVGGAAPLEAATDNVDGNIEEDTARREPEERARTDPEEARPRELNTRSKSARFSDGSDLESHDGRHSECAEGANCAGSSPGVMIDMQPPKEAGVASSASAVDNREQIL
eukprot:TRINITY_DN38881_c0_g1_i1.p1 TRINITY_DN38881_c0_g1~~TRINITY_DN38881_c0_g1_i1.p1  ORF type:complete len:906 (-),score=183.64 TRINITY_DN38881_c0_g1_i1:7-2724(-)